MLVQGPEWDVASVPIWPNHGLPVSWPPPQYFREDTVDAFSYRW
jgi:hypothetical protein